MTYLRSRMEMMKRRVGEAGHFNCYGMARFITGLTDKLQMTKWETIEEDVYAHTELVGREEAQEGDLLIFEVADFIVHAAVLVDPATGIYIEKRGINQVAYNDIDGTLAYQRYGPVTQIRRVL